VLFLIGLEYRSIHTHVWRSCGRQDGPSLRVLGGHQHLCVDGKTRADLDLGGLGLRRTASPRAFFGDLDGCDPLVPDMGAPRAWCTPTPPLAPPFVCCSGCLRGGGTGTPASCHTLAVLGDLCGLLGLRCSLRHRPLVGQLARVDDEKAELCLIEAPVSLLHGHRADDTLPVPAS